MKRVCALALIILCFLSACDNQMTKEEFASYRAKYIAEYEVCSVTQYTETETNLFGGVIDTELCYAFTYIDGNGNLQEVNGFQHLAYGLTKVCVGDSNKFVIDSFTEEKQYLYLTEDTLKSLGNTGD